MPVSDSALSHDGRHRLSESGATCPPASVRSCEARHQGEDKLSGCAESERSRDAPRFSYGESAVGRLHEQIGRGGTIEVRRRICGNRMIGRFPTALAGEDESILAAHWQSLRYLSAVPTLLSETSVRRLLELTPKPWAAPYRFFGAVAAKRGAARTQPVDQGGDLPPLHKQSADHKRPRRKPRTLWFALPLLRNWPEILLRDGQAGVVSPRNLCWPANPSCG